MTKSEMEARWRAERYEQELRIIRAELKPRIHIPPCRCDACFVVHRIDMALEDVDDHQFL